jgi:hypothetical protein
MRMPHMHKTAFSQRNFWVGFPLVVVGFVSGVVGLGARAAQLLGDASM